MNSFPAFHTSSPPNAFTRSNTQRRDGTTRRVREKEVGGGTQGDNSNGDADIDLADFQSALKKKLKNKKRENEEAFLLAHASRSRHT